MKIIGVDVGGTTISAGLVHEGHITRQSDLPTPFDRPQFEVVQAVIQSIEEVFDPSVRGIGIGVPGLVDLEERTEKHLPVDPLVSEELSARVCLNVLVAVKDVSKLPCTA